MKINLIKIHKKVKHKRKKKKGEKKKREGEHLQGKTHAIIHLRFQDSVGRGRESELRTFYNRHPPPPLAHHIYIYF